jgi:diguanylate cyclase (GGDEF)-like protein/PAS domain S-box-containing protein
MTTRDFVEKLKKLISSRYIILVYGLILLFISITVQTEIVEPFIILFVIYSSIKHSTKGAIYSVIFAIIILTAQDIYNLHIDLDRYMIEVATVLITAYYIIKSSSRLREMNEDLKERVKELSGLFSISKILERKKLKLDESLEEIVDIIPRSLQYPEDSCAKIIYNDYIFKTDNYKETKWSQKSDIIIDGKKEGEVEVCYLTLHQEEYNDTPFLKEEFQLLDDISNRIGNIIKNINQEKEIIESNKFLSITLNSIGDAVIVTDEQGQINQMNPIAEDLTGWHYEEAEGRDIKETFHIINSKTRKPVKNPVEKVFEQGKIVGLANHTKLISKDGTEYHIADSAAPIKDEDNNVYGAVMVFRDFTKQYEMDQEIKRRENLFSNVIDEAPYPLMLHNEDGEIIRINKSWQEISGYGIEDLPNLETWFEKAYGEKKDLVKDYVDNLFDKNKKTDDGEFEIITKDGQKRLWDFISVPLGVDKNNKKLILSMSVDITERKEMIKNINKLNRLYSILSDVNQAIVRNKDRDSLINEICKIIIENGDYKSTWIAKAKDDKNILSILGSAGLNSNLIANIDIDLTNNTSIEKIDNTYKIDSNTLVNFISKVRNTESEWDELTFYNNNSSMAVFPIKAFNKLWGVFSLCIDQPNYFDSQEIKLLKELTDDLAFAIESIKNESLRKKSEKKLKESEEKYRMLFEEAPVGVFKSSKKGDLILANPKLLKILGCNSIEECMDYYGDLYNVYVHSQRRKELFNDLKENDEVNDFIFKANKKGNGEIWLSLDAKVVNGNNNQKIEIDGFIEDITNEYEMRKQVEKSEEKYRTLFQNQYSVMLIINQEDGSIVDANPAACDFYGWPHKKLTSMKITEINTLSKEEVKYKMSNAADNKSNKFIFDHKLANGEVRTVEVYSGPIKLNDKEYLFSIIHDITERKKAQDRIKYMSFHDKLTGLYNRAYLEEEMKRIGTKRQLPISIIMGDLNNLKLINDTYGHEKGDELIVRAAEIIKKTSRAEDIIGRWGGDEFVILLTKTTLKESEEICERIFENAEKEDRELIVSISLGTATKNEMDENLYKTLNKAEDRMYKNKITNRRSARSSVLSAFMSTLREKSFETEEHGNRMKKLSIQLGKKIGLASSDLDRLSLLTSLHDIGKITIPQEILNKKDKLTDSEWNLIKKHTEAGYRIVSTMDELADISEYILYHHEKWDGTGYPEGLKKDEIPLLSRILAIVDAYDVMISGRLYKDPISKIEALEEIKNCSGTQFDPNLAETFVDLITEKEDL